MTMVWDRDVRKPGGSKINYSFIYIYIIRRHLRTCGYGPGGSPLSSYPSKVISSPARAFLCMRLLRLQTTKVSSVRPSAAHINDTRFPRQLIRRHTSVPLPAHHCYINCYAGHSCSHLHSFPFSCPHHYCPPWLPRAVVLSETGGRRTTRRWQPLPTTSQWKHGSRQSGANPLLRAILAGALHHDHQRGPCPIYGQGEADA